MEIKYTQPQEVVIEGYTFTQETMNSLIDLGTALKQIRKRMRGEGYTIVNGKLVELETIKYD